MWKTRTKLSNLLTNLHAGFVTALLGCILTFAPLNAMAANPSSIECVLDGVYHSSRDILIIPCEDSTQLNPGFISSITCSAADVAIACFKKGNTYYRFDYCDATCGSGYVSSTDVKTTSQCGDVTYPICAQSSGSGTGGGGTSTGSKKCQTNFDCNSFAVSVATGYTKTERGSCSTDTLTCINTTITYNCADGYSETGTVDCTKLLLGGYICSGCSQDCTTDSDCPTATSGDWNGYTWQKTGYKCIQNTVGKVCIDNKVLDCWCDTNSYGNPTPNITYSACTNLCTACPTDSKSGEAGVTTSTGVGSAETRCYIPSGNAFTDDIGTGTYSGACYY